MRKTEFKNKTFYYLLIIVIAGLLIYNTLVSIKTSNLYGTIPIFIEIVLLILIFTRDKYAKMAIYLWTVVALIISGGAELAASLTEGFNDHFTVVNTNSLIYNLLIFAVGILIIDYTRRTVFVIFVDSDVI